MRNRIGTNLSKLRCVRIGSALNLIAVDHRIV